jgi:hypothetical protein
LESEKSESSGQRIAFDRLREPPGKKGAASRESGVAGLPEAEVGRGWVASGACMASGELTDSGEGLVAGGA